MAAGPRRSWASPQPFEPRAGSGAVPDPARWDYQSRAFRIRLVLSDLFAFGGAFAVVALIRSGSTLPNLAVVGLVTALFIVIVALSRGYERRLLGDGPEEYQVLLRAGGLALVCVTSGAYTLGVDVSRLVIFLGLPVALGVALLGRYLHRQLLHSVRAEGQAMMRTLVVGDLESVRRVVDDLSHAAYHGYQVAGVCLPSLEGACPEGAGSEVLGAVADVPQVVVDEAIDVVVIAGSSLGPDALRRLTWALDRAGAQLIVAPALVEVTGPRLTLRPTAGLSLLEVEVGAPRRRLLAKTALDRVVGSALLLAALPVIGTAAALVRGTSEGSAFYRQTRVGVDGQTFTMWKIRSMYVDADQRRDELVEANEADGVLFKMREDPRVTPVGRILRRLSLDELPQLWNVVRGDMSLVGPRPPLLEEVELYGDPVQRRLRVKPGLTGLWQVSGRSDLSWEESVRLDLRYVDNWSITMDLMILWKTARAVLVGSGAY